VLCIADEIHSNECVPCSAEQIRFYFYQVFNNHLVSLNVVEMTTMDIRELNEGWNLILFLYNVLHSAPEFHLEDHWYSIQTLSVSYFSFSGLSPLTKDPNALRASAVCAPIPVRCNKCEDRPGSYTL